MNKQDDLYQKRDMMLGEIHANSQYQRETSDRILEWCQKHDEKDDKRFTDINKKLLYGAGSILIIAAATGLVPQVLGFIK